MRLTEQQAQDVWTILVATCRADTDSSGHGWESFRRYVTADHSCHEFRFMGALGFGGKLYLNGPPAPFVACHPEDKTPERARRIKLANSRLADLAEGWEQTA